MRVLFRADASTDIGWGHVMRCLTLAEALAQRRVACEFVCRNHPGHLADRIQAKGFPVHLLKAGSCGLPKGRGIDPPHAAWLGIHWREDAEQTLSVVTGEKVDWMVIDHYGLDARWHSLVGTKAHRLLVIDDLADRMLDADVMLDQNLGRTRADYQPWVADRANLLIGPRYALLRPEFGERRPNSLERRSEQSVLSHLLVTLGGTDKPNFTPRIVRTILEHPQLESLRQTVVMGRQAPGLGEVRELQKRHPHQLILKYDVDNMAELMSEVDLCVGAAGSTAWERCCLGVPTLQVVCADNQRDIAQSLAANGAALTLETTRLEDSLIQRLTSLTPASLAGMSQKAQELCDGLGAERVVTRMLERQ